MKISVWIIPLVILVIIFGVVGYIIGNSQGQLQGYNKGFSVATSKMEVEVEESYEKGRSEAIAEMEIQLVQERQAGYLEGFKEATKSPPPKEAVGDIVIQGKSGLAGSFFPSPYQEIYLKANPTDTNGFYSIYRYEYNPSDYFFNPDDFNTLGEIKEKCKWLGRKAPDSNSLIYKEFSLPEGSDFLYFLCQDDGDYSNAAHFKHSS